MVPDSMIRLFTEFRIAVRFFLRHYDPSWGLVSSAALTGDRPRGPGRPRRAFEFFSERWQPRCADHAQAGRIRQSRRWPTAVYSRQTTSGQAKSPRLRLSPERRRFTLSVPDPKGPRPRGESCRYAEFCGEPPSPRSGTYGSHSHMVVAPLRLCDVLPRGQL
jgi:hypothetical protein